MKINVKMFGSYIKVIYLCCNKRNKIMTTLDKLIKLYSSLETKQENGTITFEEDALRCRIFDMINDTLFKTKEMKKNLKYPLTKLIHWDDVLKKLVEQSADKNNRSVNGEIRHLLKKGLEK